MNTYVILPYLLETYTGFKNQYMRTILHTDFNMDVTKDVLVLLSPKYDPRENGQLKYKDVSIDGTVYHCYYYGGVILDITGNTSDKKTEKYEQVLRHLLTKTSAATAVYYSFDLTKIQGSTYLSLDPNKYIIDDISGELSNNDDYFKINNYRTIYDVLVNYWKFKIDYLSSRIDFIDSEEEQAKHLFRFYFDYMYSVSFGTPNDILAEVFKVFELNDLKLPESLTHKINEFNKLRMESLENH